jgi:ATP-dependent Clp protease ATP-binding subunit ClpB
VLQRQVANRLAEQILAGFVRDGDTVVIDAAPGGEGVTLTTAPSVAEAAATNGHATAPAAEA